MTLPTFLGIGVPRAGTTWLHQLLQTHPDIYVPTRRKELSFFDLYYGRGLGWYAKFFPDEPERTRYRCFGEVTPYYFYCEECPARIAGAGIEKLILMLRHPVDRAWSYYGQKIRNGMFRGSFEEFLSQSRWPVIEQGHYTRYLDRYFARFDRSQMLILLLEEAAADVPATRRALATFLGVDGSRFADSAVREAVNQSYVPRAPQLYGLAFRLSRLCRRLDLDWVVNAAKRIGVREAFGATGKLTPMAPETRQRLDDLFQPEITALEASLGMSMDVWRRATGARSS